MHIDLYNPLDFVTVARGKGRSLVWDFTQILLLY